MRIRRLIFLTITVDEHNGKLRWIVDDAVSSTSGGLERGSSRELDSTEVLARILSAVSAMLSGRFRGPL
jgi:hypothetical protein